MITATQIEELKAGSIVLTNHNNILMLATITDENNKKRKQLTSIFIGYEEYHKFKNVYTVLTLHFSPVRIRKQFVEKNAQVLTLVE